MFGWKGRMLRVDLSTREFSVEELSAKHIENYLGGRGIGARIFFDEVDPRVDALSANNKLIFSAGPLTGSGVPAAGRFMVISKSPLTNTISNPNCGGHFGATLKFAGYDLVIIEGKASEPVYLVLSEHGARVKSAAHLWGKSTSEAEKLMRLEEGGSDPWSRNGLSVALIGPGGENLVKFACIISDGGRAVGRSGLGAVMGSKNLKGIVVKGRGGLKIADPKGLRKAYREFLEEAEKNGQLKKRAMWGTWELPARAQATGTLSALNFQRNKLEEFKEWEDPSKLRTKFHVRDEACFGCPFRCGKRTRIADPEYPGTAKGPEYETIALLGANCGVSDMEAVCKANYLCNELGLDTINTGATISCAMELIEKGYLKKEDVGYELEFGNSEALLRAIREIGLRIGFGNILAEGGHFLAASCGRPEFFMGVKGQGMPAWNPRGRIESATITGLQYATSNVGACHTKSTLAFHSTGGGFRSLVEWTVHYQDFVCTIDSCGLCWIIYHGPLWEEKPILWLRLVTGLEYTQDQLLKIGERIWNLERIFNIRAGITKREDTLPQRMSEKPLLDEGYPVELEPMLEAYYELRGWDKEGIPTPEKLESLDLGRP